MRGCGEAGIWTCWRKHLKTGNVSVLRGKRKARKCIQFWSLLSGLGQLKEEYSVQARPRSPMIDGGCGWFPTFRHVRLAIHVLGSNPGRSRMPTFLLS